MSSFRVTLLRYINLLWTYLARGFRYAGQAVQAGWAHPRVAAARARALSWAKQHPRRLALISLAGLVWLCCLPGTLFQDPVSTVLLDRKGTFLGARIAADGQWRFPALDTVPARFAQCLITFEDKRFYYHPGIDPVALVRAISQNIRGRDVISGGSTITMQVIRLARKGKARTIWEKLVEMFLATRLDAGWRKADILALYASHAPFGGNVVGLEAAAWKYYGRSPDQLSWAEAATLAVLPNAPGLINPGKNRDLLLSKRNRLLSRLLADGTVDSTTYQTSLLEDLPGEPLALPSWAPHLLEQVHRDRPQGARQARVVSTLNASLQQRATEALTRYHTLLSQNGIDNMAAVIAEVGTGDVVAYVGNAPCESAGQGCEVDIIQAPRSTGSILKPFLYAAMLDNGELLPDMLWPDIPSYYAGFTPANYDRTYSGAIPAHQALARSLNVPIVRMLQYHGIPRFYGQLKRLGMTTLFRPADDYGLTLVLGGAEGTLWEVAGMYAGMMRTAAFFQTYNGRYDPAAFRPLNYLQRRSTGPLKGFEAMRRLVRQSPISASAAWLTLDAMIRVNRPEAESNWEYFNSSARIAWKTGTSFGFRDAWAVGCTPRYVVAVWAGNADGEGRPGLIGTAAAAPLMFELFSLLGNSREWVPMPFDEMTRVPVCRQSGHLAAAICPDPDSVWIPLAGQKTTSCPYHRLIHLDPTGTYQVNSHCETPDNMRHSAYFVLPPAQEAYYRDRNPDYLPVPPYRNDCLQEVGNRLLSMDLIYPKQHTRVYIPTKLDGTQSQVVFEAAHRNTEAIIFWHLDEQYMGQTSGQHQLAFRPTPGVHTLTLVDQQGEVLVREFEVFLKDN